jgi:hypothetical protein
MRGAYLIREVNLDGFDAHIRSTSCHLERLFPEKRLMSLAIV